MRDSLNYLVNLLFAVILASVLLSVNAWADKTNRSIIAKKPLPTFRTEVLAFEDTFLYGTPTDGSLIYRIEGNSRLIQRVAGKGLLINGGPTAYIHPAQYDSPTLRLNISVMRGEPGIAICHNGMTDTSGKPNPSPGVEIVLRKSDTAVRDLASGKITGTIPVAFPRGREAVLSIAWDFDKRSCRIDLEGHSYYTRLPDSVVRKGGFGLRAPASPSTSYRVSRIQVVWQDQRDVVLYDGADTIFDLHGKTLGRIPSATLPEGMAQYTTTAVDLKRGRSLVVMGGPDLSAENFESFKGWAVRDLQTGRLDILSTESRINGCLPFQGGGGMDGYWLQQSWTNPASLSWVDWNAYDRGNLKDFVIPAMKGEKIGDTLKGYHDPTNALDGSLCRYLFITESWRGTNRLTVHPNLLAFAPFQDMATPSPTHPLVSHTGPAGMPTQIAVRDRDRAWYEQWAYLGNGLHTQNRGYNLFARRDDWESKFFTPEKEGEMYCDFVNMAPSLQHAGELFAPMLRAIPKRQTFQDLGFYRLRRSTGKFSIEEKLPSLSGNNPSCVPFQILFDRSKLDTSTR